MAPENKRGGGNVSSALAGTLWFTGWLFTIGFAHLSWWKIIVGIIIWPYFLGVAIS